MIQIWRDLTWPQADGAFMAGFNAGAPPGLRGPRHPASRFTAAEGGGVESPQTGLQLQAVRVDGLTEYERAHELSP